MNRGSRRVAFVIARRTAIRSIGRSSLIAAMVALPVIGLTAVALVGSSMQATTQETITTVLGRSEAQLQILTPPDSGLEQAPAADTWNISSAGTGELRAPEKLFPAGTRILSLFRTTVTAATATGVAQFEAIEGSSWDASLTGHFDVIDGRVPNSDDEVMVTASALPRLGVKIGATVRLDAPTPGSVTVVGVLDDQVQPDSDQMFFGRDGAFSDLSAKDRLPQTVFYLPDTVLDWSAVQSLNGKGAVVLSRAVLENPPAVSDIQSSGSNSFITILAVGGIAAGFAAFEVILLAGAAFTVTGRQQQRTLATIASVGATRSTLFRVLSSSGVVLGAIGGVAGIAVGIGGGALFMRLTDNGSSTQYYGFHLPWLLIVAIAAFAVLIGWISALVPARNASRFDIVAALRGARRPPQPTLRRPVAGLILLLLGLGLCLGGGVYFAVLLRAGAGIPYGHPLLWLPITMLILGPVLAQIGLVLCGPLLLRTIARLMRRSGIGARLASQDAARNPGRSVPALAAIMTTTFVAVFAMCMLASAQAAQLVNHRYVAALGEAYAPFTQQSYTQDGKPGPLVSYQHPEAIADAMRSTLDVAEVRTLASVPEIQPPLVDAASSESHSTEAKTTALPVIPPENLCPSNDASPEYTTAFDDGSSPEAAKSRDDWRCQDPFLASLGESHIWIGDTGDLALILGRQPSASAQHTLAGGGAVSLYPEYVRDDSLSIAWWSDRQMQQGSDPTGPPARTETLDAVVDAPPHLLSYGIFLTAKTADRIGLDYQDSLVLASLTSLPTTAQKDAFDQAIRGLPDTDAQAPVYAGIETGPEQFAAPWTWGLLGLSALIAIAAAAVAIGLARFDGRQDDATLSSLGAGRRARRSFAFWQALVIAGTGAVLGSAMGLVPALALSANAATPFAAPWLTVALTAIALPILIACGSWLITTRARTVARRMTIA